MIHADEKSYLSRPLLMAWCCWLLGSWMVNLDIDAPRWISDDALIPASRGMFLSMMLGVGLIWPAWRLSMPLDHDASPGLQTATDLISLLAIAQLVIWPLRALLGWPAVMALLIDTALIVWAGAGALCVWGGLVGRSPASRTMGMAMAAVMLTGGPMLAALTGTVEPARWSGLHVMWTVSNGGLSIAEADAMIIRLAITGLIVGVTLVMMRHHLRPGGPTTV
ncbi:hypothetical protein HED60_07990 [Planctomycetales bacterium ZRK34]|nr:hypothetical protein HED60_07990 [Planctomycetales bacterium ZRK34]